jgi:hypothetical protein
MLTFHYILVCKSTSKQTVVGRQAACMTLTVRLDCNEQTIITTSANAVRFQELPCLTWYIKKIVNK